MLVVARDNRRFQSVERRVSMLPYHETDARRVADSQRLWQVVDGDHRPASPGERCGC
jgi:hypothetical protein